jgi:hypothetical protein
MKFAERYKTDKKVETEGKWFDWGNGGRARIARIGNPLYKEMLREEMKEYDAWRRSGRTIPEDITNSILIRCMACTIVVDWEGFSGEGLDDLGLRFNDDKTIPYSPENATILLTEFKDFRDEIANLSTDMENFLVASNEAVTKNSKTS